MEYLTLHDIPQRHMYNARRMATPDELRGPERTLPALPAVRRPSSTSSTSSSSSSPRRRMPCLLHDFGKAPIMRPVPPAPALRSLHLPSLSTHDPPPASASPQTEASSIPLPLPSWSSALFPAEFLEPPSHMPRSRSLTAHPLLCTSTVITGESAGEDSSGRYGQGKSRLQRYTLPPLDDCRQDSLIPAYTSSLRSTLSLASARDNDEHSNIDEMSQNHLTRHSPPFQPNEQQSGNVGLPSFSQVSAPAWPLYARLIIS